MAKKVFTFEAPRKSRFFSLFLFISLAFSFSIQCNTVHSGCTALNHFCRPGVHTLVASAARLFASARMLNKKRELIVQREKEKKTNRKKRMRFITAEGNREFIDSISNAFREFFFGHCSCCHFSVVNDRKMSFFPSAVFFSRVKTLWKFRKFFFLPMNIS